MIKNHPTIGFVSAPAWFDPAPAEFPSVVNEDVYTQQAPMLLPEFDYRLQSISRTQTELNLCAASLKAMGCDLVAQVGSPFAWACAGSESEARARHESMAATAQRPTIMTGLAIVDGLRSLGVRKIAVNCTYYDTDWRDGFATFMTLCGFEPIHVSTIADQGLVASDIQLHDYGWSMTPALTLRSIQIVAQAAPDAEAIVVTGAGTRTLGILSELEAVIKRPIIAADTILYWAIARELHLTLSPVMVGLSRAT